MVDYQVLRQQAGDDAGPKKADGSSEAGAPDNSGQESDALASPADRASPKAKDINSKIEEAEELLKNAKKWVESTKSQSRDFPDVPSGSGLSLKAASEKPSRASSDAFAVPNPVRGFSPVSGGRSSASSSSTSGPSTSSSSSFSSAKHQQQQQQQQQQLNELMLLQQMNATGMDPTMALLGLSPEVLNNLANMPPGNGCATELLDCFPVVLFLCVWIASRLLSLRCSGFQPRVEPFLEWSQVDKL